MVPAEMRTTASGSTQHHLRDPLHFLRQTLEPSAPPSTGTGKESVLCPRIFAGPTAWSRGWGPEARGLGFRMAKEAVKAAAKDPCEAGGGT